MTGARPRSLSATGAAAAAIIGSVEEPALSDEPRRQHMISQRDVPGLSAQRGSVDFAEHHESLDEWPGKAGGNAQNKSGRADRAWMMIRAHRGPGDLGHLATHLRHRVALGTGQAAGFRRRLGFAILGRRLVLRCARFARIHGCGVATAAGLLALALSLWSSPDASASRRFSARTAEHSRLALSRSRAHSRSVARRLQASRAAPDWLATINRYRAAAGLAAVSDHPAWDVGLQHHLTYLESTPSQYFTGQYQSAHTENPASPFYSDDGAAEAGYSDLVQGEAFTPLQAVDEWLTAPFHAIGMLRGQLRQVALADNPSTGDAGLDVIHGLNYNLPAATAPILFPGPGVTTDLLTFGGERPDPLETCGWQQDPPVGLPLIIMLPRDPAQALSATVTGPTGAESNANGRLCVVDTHTYHSSDPVYGPNARYILNTDHAVILIPRDPLTNGSYSVRIHQLGTPDIHWTFSAYAPPVMGMAKS